MKLQTTALVLVLLATTSAKPARRQRPSDADIADTDLKHGWLDGNDNNWLWGLTESSNQDSSSEESSESSEESSESSEESSESSESQSSEESSEEVLVTDQTPAPVTTTDADMTTNADDAMMTTNVDDAMTTDAEAMTATDEAMTSTDDGRELTAKPGTEATPIATSPGNVTLCVTVEIPTASPVTENRGDN